MNNKYQLLYVDHPFVEEILIANRTQLQNVIEKYSLNSIEKNDLPFECKTVIWSL